MTQEKKRQSPKQSRSKPHIEKGLELLRAALAEFCCAKALLNNSAGADIHRNVGAVVCKTIMCIRKGETLNHSVQKRGQKPN